MSEHEQPPRARGTLSKVAGGGAGSFLVVLASLLDLSPKWKLVVDASAAWLAVGISAVGPYCAAWLLHEVKYRGLCFLRNRARKFAESTEPNSEGRRNAEARFAEIEDMIGDLLRDGASSLTSNKIKKSPVDG